MTLSRRIFNQIKHGLIIRECYSLADRPVICNSLRRNLTSFLLSKLFGIFALLQSFHVIDIGSIDQFRRIETKESWSGYNACLQTSHHVNDMAIFLAWMQPHSSST